VGRRRVIPAFTDEVATLDLNRRFVQLAADRAVGNPLLDDLFSIVAIKLLRTRATVSPSQLPKVLSALSSALAHCPVMVYARWGRRMNRHVRSSGPGASLSDVHWA